MTFSPTLEAISELRIGVLGYGREGRSAVATISRYCPDADITVLIESGDAPRDVATRSGDFASAGLGDFDVLLRSPGIPVDQPALVRYRLSGGRVISPSSIWFAERPDVPVVGVTGSKGKSTTSSMISHLLLEAGRKVELAGNIGVPLLDHIDTDADVVVMELSSYQLADLQARLELGVVTRLFAEHVDWHGSEEKYFASKLRIAELLDGRPLLINGTDPRLMAATASMASRVVCNRPPGIHRVDDEIRHGQQRLISADETGLVGRHNLDNAVLALEAAARVGASIEASVRALRSFRPLAHRLETVADVAAMCWIDDSIATSPHATLAALEAVAPADVILIAGGQRRPASWSPVIDYLTDTGLLGLIVLPDNGPDIHRQFRERGIHPVAGIHAVEDLDQAVERAVAMGRPGAVVLLSPGAPSFPRFRDFEHRGERFARAVRALERERKGG